jgi:hypothetical protein
MLNSTLLSRYGRRILIGGRLIVVICLQRGMHNIDDEIVFTDHDGYIFHDSRGFEAGDNDELNIVQDFVRRKSGKKLLEDKLHAIWFVPLVSTSEISKFTNSSLGTAFRWTMIGQR